MKIMALPKWKIENDLCRCCHSEGACTNLGEPRIFDGEIEVYSEMIQECFSINISPVEGELSHITYGICENCANRVRDAMNFKQQVLECEKKFGIMYSKNCIMVSDGFRDVKIEIEVSDSESGNNLKGDSENKSEDVDDFDYPGGFDSNDGENSDLELENEVKKICSKATSKKTEKDDSKRKTNSEKSKTKKKKVEKQRSAATKAETEDDKPAKKDKDGETQTRSNENPAKKPYKDHFKKQDKYFFCTQCEKRYNSLRSMCRHIDDCVFHIWPYCCPLCAAKFKSPGPLILHKLKEHNIDERFSCSACDAQFRTPNYLKRHLDIVHKLGDRLQCPKCDYETTNKGYFNLHLQKHSTIRNYPCRFCEKSFKRQQDLKFHERIHTGDKRCVCNLCGEAFVQIASLHYHMTKYHVMKAEAKKKKKKNKGLQ